MSLGSGAGLYRPGSHRAFITTSETRLVRAEVKHEDPAGSIMAMHALYSTL